MRYYSVETDMVSHSNVKLLEQIDYLRIRIYVDTITRWSLATTITTSDT